MLRAMPNEDTAALSKIKAIPSVMHYLWKDNMKRLAAKGKALDGIKMVDIKQIVPESDKMIEMMKRIYSQQTVNQ